MRWGIALLSVLLASSTRAGASPITVRCDDEATTDFSIDGLLDDWRSKVVARTGAPPDGSIALRCAWDGTALALSLDVTDDRVVRVRGGRGHEDHVDIALAAGGAPLRATAYPGTVIAPAKLSAPSKVELRDSLQPSGFSLELRVPASRLPGFSAGTPSIALSIVFHDADLAAGGKDTDIPLDAEIELSDRADLLGDFLKASGLRKQDITTDEMAELDPDRRGKERLVAGGAIIGVITDQFAYVSLPAARAADVHGVTLLPLGPRGQQIISAVVREGDNDGTRDVLMLWAVWSGQLQPLAKIEIRREQRGKILESAWTVRGGELVVTPKPAVGWTADTWNEEPSGDADAIALPWDRASGGTAYRLAGHEVARRRLPGKR